jgi:aminomethyltransferase
MQKTPLFDEHLRLGGRMVDFAGWQLPVMYTSIVDEHVATRTAAGLFDVSHMGEVMLGGPDAEKLLRRLLPTDPGRLAPGRCMYSCLCNRHGGCIDDLFVFMLDSRRYYLVVNAARLDSDLAWLHANRSGDVTITDVSAATAKIDLQGPRSTDILLQVFSDARLGSLKRFHVAQDVAFAGSPVMVSHTGYTGERGYELYLPAAGAAALWNALLEAGRPAGLVPAGLGARNTLRLDACYSLYGHELSEDITPVEAGLQWLINSPHAYIGRDVLERQKAAGAPRELVCCDMRGRAIPRDGYRIEREGRDIGVVTSGSFSPTFSRGICLGLLTRGAAVVGDAVDIVIRGRREPARIARRPLYAYNG